MAKASKASKGKRRFGGRARGFESNDEMMFNEAQAFLNSYEATLVDSDLSNAQLYKKLKLPSADKVRDLLGVPRTADVFTAKERVSDARTVVANANIKLKELRKGFDRLANETEDAKKKAHALKMVQRLDGPLNRSSSLLTRLAHKENVLASEVLRADEELGGLKSFRLRGATQGRAAEVRRAYLAAEPEDRKRFLSTLQRLDGQIAAIKDQKEKEQRTKDALTLVRDSSTGGRIKFEDLEERSLPGRFIGVDPHRMGRESDLEGLLESIDEYRAEHAAELSSPQTVELEKLYNEAEGRLSRVRASDKATARLAGPRAELRRARYELERRIERAERLDAPAEKAAAERQLEAVKNREARIERRAVNKTQHEYSERTALGRASDWFNEQRQKARVRRLEKDADGPEWWRGVKRNTATLREEAGDAAKSLGFGFLARRRAIRIRRNEDAVKQAQRIAGPGGKWWEVYYSVSNKLTLLRVMALFIGLLFVPFGIFPFTAWAFWGLYTFIVNGGYAILVEGFNLLSSFFLVAINFVGNLVSAPVNAAGSFLTGLLGQHYSAYYFRLAGVRLQATPLVDPLNFYPRTFNTNSIASVFFDFVGLIPLADLFRTGAANTLGATHEKLKAILEARLARASGVS